MSDHVETLKHYLQNEERIGYLAVAIRAVLLERTLNEEAYALMVTQAGELHKKNEWLKTQIKMDNASIELRNKRIDAALARCDEATAGLVRVDYIRKTLQGEK